MSRTAAEMHGPLAKRVASCIALASSTVALGQPAPPSTPTQARQVLILATGGTIAGAGAGASASYRSGVVPVADLVAALPGVDKIATISAEQVTNVSSTDVNEAIWRKLLARIRTSLLDSRIAGIVITHGTSTLEETAYFLSLVLPSSKAVVLVGSMRPGGILSADGPQNLIDAVRVASAIEGRNRGVMVVMNDTIFEPSSVTKVDMHRVDAFAAPARGPIGQVLGQLPVFHYSGTEYSPAFAVHDGALPRVSIVYAYAGLSGDDVRTAAREASGLIIAGVGSGAFSAPARQAVRELASRGFPVVRTARQGSGDVWREDAHAGDRSDEAMGTIAGRELSPAKARILLMLALQKSRTRDELQSLFDRYGTGKH